MSICGGHGLQDTIWFCHCDKIEAGGYCPKHGRVPEEDRLKRRANAQAYARLVELAKGVGWVEVERRVERAPI